MEMLQTAEFWIGLVKIVWINIILSGDNAVVIALAARSLPPHQQKQAIIFGSGAAVLLRIILTVVAAKLLALPYLQIVGGLLLLWIGVQLLSEDDDGEGEAKQHGSLLAAVRTILIADLVMSLDNVIAVAAAAQGSMTLLILGLANQHPAGDLRQHADDQADGALPDHRRARRCADRLGRR
jgi:YjbE family integral membrane protein